MGKATINKTTLIGPYPVLPVTADSLDLSLQACDVGNGNQFVASGKDLLIVQNSGAAPYTFTVTSVADAQKRTGDVTTYSLAAGDVAVLLLQNDGWRQSDGYIYIAGSNIAVKFALIAL
jgi:hypothetical protein